MEQKTQAASEERERERYDAILAAINSPVDEFRAEHKRQAIEDAKRSSRENWTMRGLLATAGVAVVALIVSLCQAYFTWWSIGDAEETSAIQASDTRSALRIASNQDNLLKQSNDTARATLITGSRAWIGIMHTSSPAPTANTKLPVTVQYVNTGREPATNVEVRSQSFSLAIKNSSVAIINFDQQCTGLKQEIVGVVYPTTGFSSYSYMPHIPAKKIDSAVIGGTKLLALAGCFTYDTFKVVHYSYFCVYYQAKATPPATWNFCQVGNYAQ
jgi:hypothetical protein